MRRKRIPDKYKMGRSSSVPYIESESWKDRHARRKNAALENKDEVQRWCRKHHWKMYINNNGHHWIFKTHQDKVLEWYPSSGKLAIGKNWSNCLHCHDYTQLLEVFNVVMSA